MVIFSESQCSTVHAHMTYVLAAWKNRTSEVERFGAKWWIEAIII